jgi:hypothetical protein
MGEGEQQPAKSYRCHLMGLVGANLVVGAIVLWLLPLLGRQLAGDDGWHRLMPWSTATDHGGIAALAVGALIVGAALVIRAARQLGARAEG